MKKLLATILTFMICLGIHAQNLYVGANFHPHDYETEAEINAQIDLMQQAGFNVTRLGHLAWDSFEPSNGEFKLEWFDRVMDKMAEAGIKVILDIPVRPAPTWVHKACPGTTIVTFQGDTLQPIHRYYNDVGDPGYQQYAVRLAETLSKRYAKHPALLAFGIDNELGDGSISYSNDVKLRFINWLKLKYGSVDALNKAWAGWRWSRMLCGFDEVVLPDLDNAGYGGNAERQLDFRRFLSDEILAFYTDVIDAVNENAPGIPTYTNAWYYSGKFFDYAELSYNGKMTYGGCGYYPGTALDSYSGMRGSAFGMARIQYEQTTPHWCNEFTTMQAAPGACRKQAYMTLMYGSQMVCGWTMQSMWAGEEQYLQGLVDWDGTPNYKYYEYKQIAEEFARISPWFPYSPEYEVGICLDFASTALGRMNGYPVAQHERQAEQCFNWFFDRNMDVRIIDPVRSSLNFKLVIIPGVTYLSPETADKLKKYITEGGTVIMTSRSAMTDEFGQVLKCTQPGNLDDVFGIRLGGILENQDRVVFDEIELRGAYALSYEDFYGKSIPLVTENRYGKGRAIYIGTSAGSDTASGIIDSTISSLGIKKGPKVPERVSARWIDSDHILLLNHSSEKKTIEIKGKGKNIITGESFSNKFILKGDDAAFLEITK